MDNSPLGKLPPELRNRIYELVLRRKTAIKICFNVWRGSSLAYGDEAKGLRPTAMLRTCKQIRNECRQLFFANNTFEMEARNEEMLYEILRSFLRRLSDENTAMLRQVNVLYLRKSIDMRGGRNADAHHEALFGKLKHLRQVTKHMINCSLKVTFKNDFYAKEAFSLQGLSPDDLICDLGNFSQPWDEQIEALRAQCGIWEVTASPSYSGARDACTRLIQMLGHWRAELGKI